MATAQSEHLLFLKKEGDGQVWLSKLITQIWDISFHMWEHRNKAEHGDQLTPTQQAELNKLRQEVKEQFAQGPDHLM